MFGKTLTRDASTPVQRGRLVERGRQTCCRVEMFGIGEHSIGRLCAAKAAARIEATPGNVDKICPSVTASSSPISSSRSVMATSSWR